MKKIKSDEILIDDMTLRDYFAAKAMQSMVQRDGSAYLYTISQESYKIADKAWPAVGGDRPNSAPPRGTS